VTTFPLWLLAGLFVAGHLVWGPRWMVDGTRGIWAAWADLFGRMRRPTDLEEKR
jgi:hypothetical protein